MNRPICREDLYEFRVKLIFKQLRESHKDDGSNLDFDLWLEKNWKLAGRMFLDDVDSYMGQPSAEDEEE